MPFYQFTIKKYLTESNFLGALAILVQRDPNFPRRATKWKTLKKYMVAQKISIRLMRAFEFAYKNYQRTRMRVTR